MTGDSRPGSVEGDRRPSRSDAKRSRHVPGDAGQSGSGMSHPNTRHAASTWPARARGLAASEAPSPDDHSTRPNPARAGRAAAGTHQALRDNSRWSAISRRPGAILSESSYGRTWQRARRKALTPSQANSPLAARPYDLRRSGVTLALNAGVPAPEARQNVPSSGVLPGQRTYSELVAGVGFEPT